MDSSGKINDLDLAREVPDFSPQEHEAPPPKPKGLIERLELVLKHVINWSTVVGGIGLVAMLVISVADVIGIKIFNTPVPGGPEFVSFIMVVVVAFAMGYTLVERAHIQVDIFINKLPKRLKSAVEAFVSLLGLGLFVILAWYSVVYGNQLRESKEVSMTQHIPFYPFVYSIALACVPVCLYLFLEVLRWAIKVVKK
ncbi:MAG: TRAP transporter small permease [Dehalococcoidales bacterium]|nr:TRAP transporter small permease [Dehalococcoidales bacterium]